MTATPAQPYTPSVPCAQQVPRAVPRGWLEGREGPRPRGAARDLLTLVLLPLPLLALALPAAFAGGGTRRWFGGRAESQRAEAQAAKDAAAAAFYELDTAQRDLRISIETITAVDDSPAARRAVADFDALGRRIDEVSHKYISAVDAHDLDRDDLEASVAARARTELTRAKDELDRVKQELDRFARRARAAARQGRDPAGPARARRRARPAGPARRLERPGRRTGVRAARPTTSPPGSPPSPRADQAEPGRRAARRAGDAGARRPGRARRRGGPRGGRAAAGAGRRDRPPAGLACAPARRPSPPGPGRWSRC